MQPSRVGTVALIITRLKDGDMKTDNPLLIEKISDDREIELFEAAVEAGETSPLGMVYEFRDRKTKEEDEFGNYVEELLSQPFIKTDIQKHAVDWLKSKIRMEQFQKTEREATEIIAQYAFRLFLENPDRLDFFLAGPSAKVRIRIFDIPCVQGEADKEDSKAA